MRKLKLLYAFAAALFVFCSCKNDNPTFDDADAFVAFDKTTVSVVENKGELKIPVTLASLSGIETDVEFEAIEADSLGAKQGVHYNIVGEKKLHFTKAAPTQYITLQIIDNDTFGGNVKFQINLKKSSVNLGASASCIGTIEDDEHPLKFVLNDYTGSYTDFWGAVNTFNWSIKADETDLNKVWIYNIAPYFGSDCNAVYGTVSEDHTQLIIPAGQSVWQSSTYNMKLWTGPEEDPALDEELYDNMDIVVDIQDGGKTLYVRQGWCVYDGDQNAIADGYPAGLTLTQK